MHIQAPKHWNSIVIQILPVLYPQKSIILSWPSRTFPDQIITSLILSTLPSTFSNTQALFHKLFSCSISFLPCCILPRKTFSELLSHLSVLSCLQILRKIIFLIFTFFKMEIIFACSEGKKKKSQNSAHSSQWTSLTFQKLIMNNITQLPCCFTPSSELLIKAENTGL